MIVAEPVDMNALMREGHVHLREAEQRFAEMLVARVAKLPRPIRIFEIGCASGVLTAFMAEQFPDAQIIANEEFPDLAKLARKRLEGTRVTLYTGPFAEWQGQVDIVVSAGAHHHLVPGYIDHVHRILRPGGVFIVGDEFCPEYLEGALARRVAEAEVIHFAKGFVLTTHAEVEAFEKAGEVPDAAREAERLRKRALWHWYRFVVDRAMENDHVEVAIAELQSTHDDLITGSDDEHKFCGAIFERQLKLAGFRQLSKHIVGERGDSKLQSFLLYEYKVDPEARRSAS